MTDIEDIAHMLGTAAAEIARCPQCGSDDVSASGDDYRCNDCGREWAP